MKPGEVTGPEARQQLWGFRVAGERRCNLVRLAENRVGNIVDLGVARSNRAGGTIANPSNH